MPVAKKKKYRVVGPLPVFENMPGKVFDAVIPYAQEKRLIDAGHLEVTSEVNKKNDS